MFNRRKFLQKTGYLMAAAHLPLPAWAHTRQSKRPVVVRIHAATASIPWDYQAGFPWDHTVEPKSREDMSSGRFRTDRYYDHLNQEMINSMVSQGICFFTGVDNAEEAWKNLLRNYRQGQKITIKINLNNASFNEDVTTNRMDQSVQMINALVDSLTSSIGIAQSQITIADPSRWIHPMLLRQQCPYGELRWVDSKSDNLWDPAETVVFSADQPIRPDGPHFPEKGTFHLARVYTEADHIINVCLLKNHGCGITGAMKNHFGAIPPPFPKYLHDGLGSKSYIADICNTPSIRDKVRLNVCEAIFANWHNNVWCPRPWKTFAGGTPNSLFFGTDPVAFDSVLLQHISDEISARGDEVEQWVKDRVTNHQFLHYAMNTLNLGIHEHKPFQQIDYREIEAT